MVEEVSTLWPPLFLSRMVELKAGGNIKMNDPSQTLARELVVRKGTTVDAQLLAALGAKTFYDAYAPMLPAAELAAFVMDTFSPELQAAELADPATVFLILEVDGVVAGYAKLQAEPLAPAESGTRDLKVARIYLRQEWTGRGAGSALMAACLAEAASAGFDTIWLEVWEENTRAQAFYRKWGFAEVGSVTFPFGSQMQTDLVLQRPVNRNGPNPSAQ